LGALHYFFEVFVFEVTTVMLQGKRLFGFKGLVDSGSPAGK
jgi:hypothetical protein